MNVNEVIGDKLLEMRLRAGMTQQQVTDQTGILRPIVGRIERGVHEPKLDTLVRYLEAVGGDLLEVTRAVDVALGLDHVTAPPRTPKQVRRAARAAARATVSR